MNHNLYQFLFGHLCFCADLLIIQYVGEPYIIFMSAEAAFCWTGSSIPILGARTVILLLQLWSQGSLSHFAHHSQGYSMVSSTNNHKADEPFPKFKLHFLCCNWVFFLFVCLFLFLALPSCRNTHRKTWPVINYVCGISQISIPDCYAMHNTDKPKRGFFRKANKPRKALERKQCGNTKQKEENNLQHAVFFGHQCYREKWQKGCGGCWTGRAGGIKGQERTTARDVLGKFAS